MGSKVFSSTGNGWYVENNNIYTVHIDNIPLTDGDFITWDVEDTEEVLSYIIRGKWGV